MFAWRLSVRELLCIVAMICAMLGAVNTVLPRQPTLFFREFNGQETVAVSCGVLGATPDSLSQDVTERIGAQNAWREDQVFISNTTSSAGSLLAAIAADIRRAIEEGGCVVTGSAENATQWLCLRYSDETSEGVVYVYMGSSEGNMRRIGFLFFEYKK